MGRIHQRVGHPNDFVSIGPKRNAIVRMGIGHRGRNVDLEKRAESTVEIHPDHLELELFGAKIFNERESKMTIKSLGERVIHKKILGLVQPRFNSILYFSPHRK